MQHPIFYITAVKKSKSVLVINSNEAEIEVIRKIFNRIDGNIMVLSVNSGRDALDAIMGGFRGLKKVTLTGNPFRPELILIDEELNDMRAFAFLEIIKKYYSLSQIKSYLLAEKINEWQENPHYALVDGFLQRPITDDPQTFEIFNNLVGKLNQDTIAGTPLLGLAGASALKGKIFAIKASGALFKVAACIAGVTVLTAAVIESRKQNNSAQASNCGKTAIVKGQSYFIADPVATVTLDTFPTVNIDQPELKITVTAEQTILLPQDTVEVLTEVVAGQDSVRPPRRYSIGVRRDNDIQ